MTAAPAPAPLIQMTVGPRNAWSDGALRFYRWKGQDYPSVTTIRRMAGMPFGLHEWALGKTITRAIEGTHDLDRILSAGTPEAEKAARTWLRNASIEERDAAANLGTRVHDAAQAGLTVNQVSSDVAPFLRQYLHWLAESGADVLFSERQAWNLTLGYAGTFDLIARFRSGLTYLIDLKTGKGTYTEHALQLIAYSMAEFVGEDDVVDEEASQALVNVNGIALLHIRPDGWTWKQVTPTPRMFRAFRGLLDFATFAHEFQKIDDLVHASKSGSAPE